VVRFGLHAGSVAVRRFIEERKPLFSVSGHIHEAQGVDRIGDTVVINTGPALAGNYAEIAVDASVSVKFEKF
jgi:Icc-related predicted phosphoesterase